MVKKLIAIVCISTFLTVIPILLVPTPVYAYFADLSTTNCPGTGCVNYNAEGQTQAAIQITGTFSGTITFKSSVDGTNYVVQNVVPVASGTAVSTTTGVGIWTIVLQGHKSIQVVFTSYSSGTATVTYRSLSK